MDIRPFFVAVFLGVAIVVGGSAALPASAEGKPVVAVFEPDATDLGSFPLPNHLLSRGGVNRVPGSSQAVASVNAVSGFSTAAPIYVPFRGTVDPRTVTPQSVVLVEAASGARPLVDRAVVTYENGSSVIRIDPLVPLRGGSRYMVFVTDAVRGGGAPVRASAFLQQMKQARPFESAMTEARRREYEAIWRVARNRVGLDPAHVVQAFAFTTQPIGKVLPVMRARVQKTTPAFVLTESAITAEAVAALYKKMGSGAYGHSHVGMVFIGTMTSPRYVEKWSSTAMRFKGPTDPVPIGTVDVPFLATIPAGAKGPVPVILYAHGSYRDKSDILRIADDAAAAGVAMIGIDAELHGDRSVVVDGVRQHSGTNLINLERPMQLRDTWFQTYSDTYSLVRMIRLGNTRFTGGEALLSNGRMAYMGHSMGALMGGAFSATEPGIAVSVLNVPGGKVRTLLLESGWFNPRFNAEMARRGIRPVTAAYDQYLWMYQTAVDDSDPFSYGPALRAARTQVLIQEMAFEDVMPNKATEDLARSIGLTQVQPVRPVTTLTQGGWPFFGSALFQFAGGGHNTIVETTDGPTSSVHQQGIRYVTTGLKGKAEVIMPEIPIPDMHLNMPAAPGE